MSAEPTPDELAFGDASELEAIVGQLEGRQLELEELGEVRARCRPDEALQARLAEAQQGDGLIGDWRPSPRRRRQVKTVSSAR
jgi:hypothetical protein